MGCSQFSKTPVISSITSSNQVSRIIKAETTNTMSATNLFSRIPSLKVSSKAERPCLRINIAPPFDNFLLEDLDNLDLFSHKLHNIRKYWLVYKALKTNFESQVHSVCIPNYTLKDGLIVLSLSISATYGYSVLKFSENPPFIFTLSEVPDSASALYKSWNEFAGLLNTIQKQEHVRKVRKYITSFNIFIANNSEKSFLTLTQAIELGNEFIEGVEDAFSTCLAFVKDSEKLKKYIEEMAGQFYSSVRVSPSQIVHKVFQ